MTPIKTSGKITSKFRINIKNTTNIMIFFLSHIIALYLVQTTHAMVWEFWYGGQGRDPQTACTG